MLTFLHFMAGSLSLLAHKEKTLRYFLIAGFIAILPDCDLIFNWLHIDFWIFTHRGIMHSLIATLIIGILTLLLFRNFWLGSLAHLSHILLDIIDPFGGAIMLLPGIWLSYNLNINRDIFSGIAGTLIIVSWMIYGHLKPNQR